MGSFSQPHQFFSLVKHQLSLWRRLIAFRLVHQPLLITAGRNIRSNRTLDTNQASGNVTIFEALDPSTIVVPTSGNRTICAVSLEQDGGDLTASSSIDAGTGDKTTLNGGTNGAASILITQTTQRLLQLEQLNYYRIDEMQVRACVQELQSMIYQYSTDKH